MAVLSLRRHAQRPPGTQRLVYDHGRNGDSQRQDHGLQSLHVSLLSIVGSAADASFVDKQGAHRQRKKGDTGGALGPLLRGERIRSRSGSSYPYLTAEDSTPWLTLHKHPNGRNSRKSSKAFLPDCPLGDHSDPSALSDMSLPQHPSQKIQHFSATPSNDPHFFAAPQRIQPPFPLPPRTQHSSRLSQTIQHAHHSRDRTQHSRTTLPPCAAIHD